MTTIVAMCPYCRAGGVRAPATAVGSLATCPKCRSSFTVIPSDDPLPGATGPSASPPVGGGETRPAAALPDVTEPSPVLSEDEEKPAKRKPKPAVAAPPEPAAESEEPAEPTDLGMMFALGALILVGPAVLASQLPFGRVIATVLAAIGLIGGALCLGTEGKARRIAAGAVFLHFVTLVVVVFLPGWLNLDPWSGPPPSDEPKGPQAAELATGTTVPLTPNNWLDAGRYGWQLRDVRVSARAAVGPIELIGPKGAKRTTKEHYLYLTLQVRNVGFDREIPLSGWAASEGANGVQVIDANGKPLALATFEAGWAPDRARSIGRAMPGQAPEVLLLYVAPPAKTDHVRVQLSGTAIGAPEEEIKFRTGIGGLVPRGPLP
jgi:hypothetical protein